MTRATSDGTDEVLDRLREVAGRRTEQELYREAFAGEVRSILDISVDEPTVDPDLEGVVDDR